MACLHKEIGLRKGSMIECRQMAIRCRLKGRRRTGMARHDLNQMHLQSSAIEEAILHPRESIRVQWGLYHPTSRNPARIVCLHRLSTVTNIVLVQWSDLGKCLCIDLLHQDFNQARLGITDNSRTHCHLAILRRLCKEGRSRSVWVMREP